MDCVEQYSIYKLKQKWSPLLLVYPHHVGISAGLSALHVSVCCCNQGRHPFQ